jgi:eukaryotic-like serine/threonine-protein kinase
MTDEETRAHGSDSAGGERIGPYRLLQRLGDGGMGEVWLAEQTAPVRRQVALKLIKAGMDTAHVIARFEAERQALAVMDHPSIAKVFDAGATPLGRPYFVMEYVRGEPITGYCNRHRLTTRQRIDLFLEVCGGVQHAHQKGIIHRDLKPSNILITIQDDRPVPKIIDFGVAKATTRLLTDRSLYTELGVLIGTPEYMSPEQAEMTGLDIDTRTDVYALGVILYELLTGVLPFDAQALRAKGLDEIRRTIRESEPPRPSARVTALAVSAGRAETERPALRTLASQLRGDLDWITLRALEKDRTRRYGSAADLAGDLRRHLDNLPVLASPPSVSYRVSKFVRRHRVGVSVAATLLLLLVAFAATTAIQARRIAAERDRANREAEIARAVNDFLQNDLLAQASATAQAGRNTKPDPDLKVRTALDRAAASVEQKFARQPEVEASIRQTIGATYQDLGLFAKAEAQLTRALALRRALLGDRHLDTLATKFRLASTVEREGKYSQAKALFQDVVSARRQSLGEDHPDTLAAMNGVAVQHLYLGEYAEGERLLKATLEGQRRALGEQDRATLLTMNNLIGLYARQGKYAEAEPIAQKLFDLRQHLLGPEHPETLVSMYNLGSISANLGKLDWAESLFTSALAIQQRVLGPEHPTVLTSMRSLAWLYRQEGKTAEGEQLLARTLELRKKVLGPEHPDTLVAMSDLGNFLAHRGAFAEAESMVRHSLELRQKTLGERNPTTLSGMEDLADIYRAERKLAQADTVLARLFELRSEVLGRTHPDTVNALVLHGRTRLEQRMYDDASSMLRKALDEYERSAPESWRRYRCESLLGGSLAGLGQYEAAEPLLLSGYRGLEARKATMGVNAAAELDEAEGRVTQLYRDWGKPVKAAEWSQKRHS